MKAEKKDFIYRQYRHGFTAAYIVAGNEPVCHCISSPTKQKAREQLTIKLNLSGIRVV